MAEDEGAEDLAEAAAVLAWAAAAGALAEVAADSAAAACRAPLLLARRLPLDLPEEEAPG